MTGFNVLDKEEILNYSNFGSQKNFSKKKFTFKVLVFIFGET